MCGIAGLLKKSKIQSEYFIDTALDCLKERGPDQKGVWEKENIVLVHRRLSILDLTDAGKQPMTDEDSGIVIVYNGEIYNYLFIKRELELEGIRFKTNTDTEVIIQGYKRWGIDKLLGKFEGMFAFGLIDFHKNSMYLVRDEFGKKPLYYYIDNTSFVFSSDIRIIYKYKQSSLVVDLESIDYYLSELAMPQPKSIWVGVSQVPPASYLKIDLKEYTCQFNSYWKLEPTLNLNISKKEAIDCVEHVLVKSILRRTISDVPFGAFLSGGIDSGLIVSILASNYSSRIKTYTLGFNGVGNELPEARLLSDRLQTDHHEIIITPDIVSKLPDILKYVAEPFADSSIIPSYFVCHAMKSSIKVVLSGDGGDELFGGYTQYLEAYNADQFLAKYQDQKSQFIAAQLDKITARIQLRSVNLGSAYHYSKLAPPVLLHRDIGFSEKEKNYLYAAGYTNNYFVKHTTSTWLKCRHESLCSKLMISSLSNRLLNDYLVKIDRASMMNSIEVRSPFLDKELLNLAFQIPNNIKFSNSQSKYMLKEIGKKYLHTSVLANPKKGFSIPLDKWLHNELREYVVALTSNSAPIYDLGIFSEKYISRFVSNFIKGDTKNVNKIWILVCLNEWCRQYY